MQCEQGPKSATRPNPILVSGKNDREVPLSENFSDRSSDQAPVPTQAACCLLLPGPVDPSATGKRGRAPRIAESLKMSCLFFHRLRQAYSRLFQPRSSGQSACRATPERASDRVACRSTLPRFVRTPSSFRSSLLLLARPFNQQFRLTGRDADQKFFQ